MTIPQDQLKKWEALKSRGDGAKILKDNPSINAVGIYRAFKTGKCPDAVFNALAVFYKGKNERVQEMTI